MGGIRRAHGVRGILLSASLVDVWPWMAKRVPPPSLWLIGGYYAALALLLAVRVRFVTTLQRRALAACPAAGGLSPHPSSGLHDCSA